MQLLGHYIRIYEICSSRLRFSFTLVPHYSKYIEKSLIFTNVLFQWILYIQSGRITLTIWPTLQSDWQYLILRFIIHNFPYLTACRLNWMHVFHITTVSFEKQSGHFFSGTRLMENVILFTLQRGSYIDIRLRCMVQHGTTFWHKIFNKISGSRLLM